MKPHALSRATPWLYGGIVAAVLVYAFVLIPHGAFEVPRLKTQDLFFRLAHALRPLPLERQEMVLVTIDDESLSLINKKWPWEREAYARVLEVLAPAKPSAVAFDIVFLGESVFAESDLAFAEAIGRHGNTVLASYVSDNGAYVTPLDLFAKRSVFGPINKPRDADDLVRSGRLTLAGGYRRQESWPTFEMHTLATHYGMTAENAKREKGRVAFHRPNHRDGDLHVPTREDGSFLINYIARFEDFAHVPIWRVIRGQPDPEIFRDKIVLIGQNNEIIHDVHPTPLGRMPGMVISANILLTMLSQRFLTELPNWHSGLTIVLFCLLSLWIGARANAGKGTLLMLLLLACFSAYAYFLFRNRMMGDFFSVPFAAPTIFVIVQLYKSLILFIENIALQHDAITDGLTGLYIHKYLLVRLQNELERAKRYHQKLAIALIDVDFFKRFNDTYGHEEGNRALVHFAGILKDSFRKADLVFRYGGEEFCVLLPGSEGNHAAETMDRFRKRLEHDPITVAGKKVPLLASVGLACYEDGQANEDIHDFLRKADQALYAAKRSGRNKTCQYRDAA